MTLLGTADGDGSASGNTWQVDSIRVSTGDVSSTTADMGDIFLNTAYVTLEAMVIYSCAAYPKSNSVLFDNNTVVDRAGSALKSAWTKELRHTECGQDVMLDTSTGDVTLSWDAAR